MSGKKEQHERVVSLLKDKGLKHVFLENYIHCSKWPGRENPYQIVELLLCDDDRIEVWQGPGYRFQNVLVYLDEFDTYEISKVEKELINTLAKLKHYRVQVISYVDVEAPSPERAEDLVSSSRFKAKEILRWVELGHKTKELNSND